MANKRIYSLTPIAVDPSTYSIALDKSGNQEALSTTIEDLKTVFISTPVITEPTIAFETGFGYPLTQNWSFVSTLGRTKTYQLNFSFTPDDMYVDIDINLDEAAAGTVGQQLNCVINDKNGFALVIDDSPKLILRIYINEGASFLNSTISVSGTLITT